MDGLIELVAEAMAPGVVTSRAMMGGRTLYCDGTVFAIVADDLLWFKADKVSDAEWDGADAPRFTVQMGDRVGSMNYRRAPDDCYDDPDALRRWGWLALEAGMRAPPKRAKAPRSTPRRVAKPRQA
ncbi:TfoX/Sxy family protein [Sphingomonas sp.]|jgi:DNA transformation protein|uniref:TfoX/Sxy family protein n=1 Tax=Sphingomonas sp. TaxID=28214 RepID=UPI002D8031C8|nr:TfoX/Sxy family protein [Sphingomonas sp.]HEU0043024.1 TfoX/Sxy family protein [Sphingomonas sp.]